MNSSDIKKIALDIETTGLQWNGQDRIIEIVCVELTSSEEPANTFHVFINPDCEIEASGTAIHGFTSADLCDKPKFSAIASGFLDFVKGAELLIHNAKFDVNFLDAELARMGLLGIKSACAVTDTLRIARSLYPGESNSLDTLCKRFGIKLLAMKSSAMQDATLIAEIYRAMTVLQARQIPKV